MPLLPYHRKDDRSSSLCYPVFGDRDSPNHPNQKVDGLPLAVFLEVIQESDGAQNVNGYERNK